MSTEILAAGRLSSLSAFVLPNAFDRAWSRVASMPIMIWDRIDAIRMVPKRVLPPMMVSAGRKDATVVPIAHPC
jgi:hypothetical protein